MVEGSIRVGFIGASGTGKTSVAQELSRAKDLPLHPSVVRGTFAKFNQTQMSLASSPVEQQWLIQNACFQEKIIQDAANLPGIYERTLLDHYCYCLLYCAPVISDEVGAAMEWEVLKNLSQYSLLYYFPLYPWPTSPADGFRVVQNTFRETQDLILRGFLTKHRLWNEVHTMLDRSVLQRVQVISLHIAKVQNFGIIRSEDKK